MGLRRLVVQGCGLLQAPEHPRQAALLVRLASNVMELEERRSVLRIPTLLPGHQSVPRVAQAILLLGLHPAFRVVQAHRLALHAQQDSTVLLEPPLALPVRLASTRLLLVLLPQQRVWRVHLLGTLLLVPPPA